MQGPGVLQLFSSAAAPQPPPLPKCPVVGMYMVRIVCFEPRLVCMFRGALGTLPAPGGGGATGLCACAPGAITGAGVEIGRYACVSS